MVRVVEVSSCEVAEAAKLLENIYRCVNIALVNELKMCFERMGFDIWEVIAAASTKPFGFQPFYPGPGLGGHCIPLDPFYLSWKAKEYQFTTRFIDLAGEINVQMPFYVLNVRNRPSAARKRPSRARASWCSVSPTRRTSTTRANRRRPRSSNSWSRRARPSPCHDPSFKKLPSMRHYKHIKAKTVELTEKALRETDATIIVTDHSAYDYPWIVKHATLVLDTRNACKDVKLGAEKIVKA